MKNIEYLHEVAAICLEKLDALNIKYGIITDFSINTRAKKRFGQCVRKSGLYSINISSMLLQENIPQINLETVIMHEIIHTCNGCFNHGDEWKRIADIVNRAYGYQIKCTASYAEMGISQEDRPTRRVKYIVACDGECHRRSEFGRINDFVRMMNHLPNGFECRVCGGRIKRIL